jgi:hypothetical protein
MADHVVRIVVDGRELRPSTSYSIDVDMLQPAVGGSRPNVALGGRRAAPAPPGAHRLGAADGETLVVASPKYNQAPQWDFYETLARGSNVLSMSFERSTASRYALIEVSGSGRAPGAL